MLSVGLLCDIVCIHDKYYNREYNQLYSMVLFECLMTLATPEGSFRVCNVLQRYVVWFNFHYNTSNPPKGASRSIMYCNVRLVLYKFHYMDNLKLHTTYFVKTLKTILNLYVQTAF